MTQAEVSAIEHILLSKKPHADVLEWGTGGSTVHFTRFLREHGISYTWTGVEYNKRWHERVRTALEGDPDVHIELFDVGNDENKQRDIPMDEYVAYPATLGKKFDVIIVDGRKRRRCLLEAAKLLKPGGVALLHDARRSHYHCAFAAYPDSRIVLWSGLWQGRSEDPGLMRRFINSIHYWRFRAFVFSLRFRIV